MKEGKSIGDGILLIVPFHDWRKIQLEGFRTRDSHFIEEFAKLPGAKIIVNRPTTHLEINFKRKPGLIKGELLLKNGVYKLYRLEEELYLIDFISIDILGQIFKKFEWFINRYGDNGYVNFIRQSISFLGAREDECRILNQNIFAYKLNEKINAETKVFDAWDNFIKFDVYSSIREKIVESYSSFGKTSKFWITNSLDNISVFNEMFQPMKIHLIKNGVDLQRFTSKSTKVPKDLQKITRPIAGFGGKITHLIDVELLNETIKKSPNISFVIIGQILDKKIFDAIEKADNFYYLGDKYYDQYPNYVKNFDICIVPYVIDEARKSGANTIKVYEYLATRNKVVGTPSNGLEDLEEYVYLVRNAEEFSRELQKIANEREQLNLEFHSWRNRTENLLALFGMNDY